MSFGDRFLDPPPSQGPRLPKPGAFPTSCGVYVRKLQLIWGTLPDPPKPPKAPEPKPSLVYSPNTDCLTWRVGSETSARVPVNAGTLASYCVGDSDIYQCQMPTDSAVEVPILHIRNSLRLPVRDHIGEHVMIGEEVATAVRDHLRYLSDRVKGLRMDYLKRYGEPPGHIIATVARPPTCYYADCPVSREVEWALDTYIGFVATSSNEPHPTRPRSRFEFENVQRVSRIRAMGNSLIDLRTQEGRTAYASFVTAQISDLVFV